MPMTSRISSKGQVTVPKAIREMLKIEDGDRIKFITENGKVYIAKTEQVVVNYLDDSKEPQQDK